MKKELLSFLLPIALVSGQVAAQDYCEPDNEWQPYAGISRVEINGMINESGKTPVGETCDFFEYYMGEPDKLVTLQAGQTYKLKIDFDNFNTGESDPYYMRAYFDWNADGEFSSEETYKTRLIAGPKGGTVPIEFDITVPEDARTGVVSRMRVFTSYISSDPTYSGEGPCDLVEGGNFEDYDLKITSGAGLAELSDETFAIGPNPTRGELIFRTPVTVKNYLLYTANGQLVQEGQVEDNRIDLSGNQAGCYMLRVFTDNGTRQATVIVK